LISPSFAMVKVDETREPMRSDGGKYPNLAPRSTVVMQNTLNILCVQWVELKLVSYGNFSTKGKNLCQA